MQRNPACTVMIAQTKTSQTGFICVISDALAL